MGLVDAVVAEAHRAVGHRQPRDVERHRGLGTRHVVVVVMPHHHHPAEHAEDVEHREVEPAAREGAEAGEVRLVLELERPGDRALEVDAVAVGEVVGEGEAGRGVARVHRAAAVRELGALAGRTALGVGLADHDGRLPQLGIRGDGGEPGVDRPQVRRDPHADVAVHGGRGALRVEGDEVQRRAGAGRGVIGAAEAVLDEGGHATAAVAAGSSSKCCA